MKKTKSASILRFISLLFVCSFLIMFTVGAGGGSKSSSCSSSKEKSSKKKKKKRKREIILTKYSGKDKDDSTGKKGKADEKGNSKVSDEDSEEEDGKNKKDKKEKKKGHSHDKDKKDSDKNEDSSPSAEVVWNDLLKGNRRFMRGRHTDGGFISSRKKLTKGQNPVVIVISCSDSRVPPELVFDKNLGEIFVIRTAGNVADPVALGSIEYAAEHLRTNLLVVLGHESCGAVGAAISGEKMPTRNLNSIVKKIIPSFKSSENCKIGSEGGIECVELNIAKSAKDIVAKSPILSELVKEDKFTVIKAIYKMESGKVEKID